MDNVETYQILIRDYLSGSASEAFIMVKLMGQVLAIMITGIVLWRVSTIFSRRKKNRHKSVFSESRFQEHWRK